jgi:hypothetical protein
MTEYNVDLYFVHYLKHYFPTTNSRPATGLHTLKEAQVTASAAESPLNAGDSKQGLEYRHGSPRLVARLSWLSPSLRLQGQTLSKPTET